MKDLDIRSRSVAKRPLELMWVNGSEVAMREYGRIAMSMWTRGSGKRLRGDAMAQAVACYLASAPGSNMIGLYHLTVATISADMGHSPANIRTALTTISAAGLAYYDEEAELVWIPNVAGIEIGDSMSPGDKRRQTVDGLIRGVGSHRFVAEFMTKYGGAFCLTLEGASSHPGRGIQPPWKGLLSPVQSSSSDSLSSGEVQEGDAAELVPDHPAPPRSSVDSGIFGTEGHRWAAGVAKGSGVPLDVPDRFGAARLASLVKTHSGGLLGAAAGDWLESIGEAYGRATAWNTTLWARTPKRFGEWLSAGRPAEPAKLGRDGRSVPTDAAVVADLRAADRASAKLLREREVYAKSAVAPPPDLLAALSKIGTGGA